jgi:superoxide dismutase, Cu-Zn family
MRSPLRLHRCDTGWTACVAGLALSLLGTGCRGGEEVRKGPPHASAHIDARIGLTLVGVATFEEFADGVHVTVDVIDAPPGLHGVHVHEACDCAMGDSSSSGGDFNPDLRTHGAPNGERSHAGDLGNILISPKGQGHLELVTRLVTVSPGSRSVVGRTLVVHQFEDDFATQPSGGTGGRIGCGEILRD